MTAVMVKKLDVIGTIKEGFELWIKNVIPIGVNALLWILTCWIPYLNIGTTIGLFVGIITKLGKGETISMTEIFNPDYRKYMGEFLLTGGLMGMGIVFSGIFFFIPAIVISLAWGLAPLLVIDKGINPVESLAKSNNCTYGNKWRIFGIYFLFNLAFIILFWLFSVITRGGGAMVFFFIILMAAWLIGYEGIQASIYKQLTEDI